MADALISQSQSSLPSQAERFFSDIPGFCVCGSSGAGKTTLIEKMIRLLLERGFRPGFLKHSGHPHSFDVAGKDTARQTEAGSRLSAVFSDSSWCIHGKDAFFLPALGIAGGWDFMVVEGFAGTPLQLPKVWLHHSEKSSPRPSGVVCEVFPGEPNSKAESPSFSRDEPEAILDFVLDIVDLQRKAMQPVGAVLVGGLSQRMGEDKFLINYHGLPEYLRMFKMLKASGLFSKVVLSGRLEQRALIEDPEAQNAFVADAYSGIGPAGGILTLLEHSPGCAMLVAGCDYPNLSPKLIELIVNQRNPFKPASLLKSAQGHAETVLGIYEPAMRYAFHRMLLEKSSPQKILAGLGVNFIDAKSAGLEPPESLDTSSQQQSFKAEKRN